PAAAPLAFARVTALSLCRPAPASLFPDTSLFRSTPRCRLRRTAASLHSALYSWTFFGPARGTRHLPLLGGSVYKSEAGSPASFKRLLGRCSPMLTPTGLTLYRPAGGRPAARSGKGL